MCISLKSFIIEFSFKGDILNKPMILGHENLSKDRTSEKKKIRFHCHASSKRRQTHKMAHCELHCHFQKTNSCTHSLLHTFSTSWNYLFRHRPKFYRGLVRNKMHLSHTLYNFRAHAIRKLQNLPYFWNKKNTNFFFVLRYIGFVHYLFAFCTKFGCHCCYRCLKIL